MVISAVCNCLPPIGVCTHDIESFSDVGGVVGWASTNDGEYGLPLGLVRCRRVVVGDAELTRSTVVVGADGEVDEDWLSSFDGSGILGRASSSLTRKRNGSSIERINRKEIPNGTIEVIGRRVVHDAV